MAIERISAVTLAVRDMVRSVAFYQDLGFRLVYGGVDASFTSLQAGEAFVNLSTVPTYGHAWWGRAIFRVDDADAQYQAFIAAGLSPESPRDAAWGERFFHVLDPDGHELSFAEVLPSGS